jgi:rod shape-determining protein MreC
VVVASLTLIVLSALGRFAPDWFASAASFVVSPVERWLGQASSSVAGFFGNLGRLGSMEAENAELRRKVEELSAENIRLRQVDETNRRLTELLEVSDKYSDYPVVGAYVIGRSTDNWFNTFTIDKGTREGIAVDMAVLAAGGLCGRVYEVGYNYAKVRPIIDDTSAVSAMDARTGDNGFVRGDYRLMLDSRCVMDFLSADAAIEPGDELVTGRLSTIYPPGIIIGDVLSVSVGADGTKRAIVAPYVDFKYIESVLVITRLLEDELIGADAGGG